MDATRKTATESQKVKNGKRNRFSEGPLHTRWDADAPVTLHGYLPFLAEYLKSGGIFRSFVDRCPISFKSNNAPDVADVLATLVLSLLSGHTRYNHMQSLYGDSVAAGLLGADKIVSHDSLRRALAGADEKDLEEWLRGELRRCYEPLLSEPYIIDIDPTVKPLYGHQEGAEIGYNPKKPGRPSQCLHSYFIGRIRILLDVDVRPGKQTAGKYSHDGLWNLLDTMLPGHLQPSLIRGDIAYGNDGTMSGCESRGRHYLFKLRQSTNVRRLIRELSKMNTDWKDAGEGWLGFYTGIRLDAWSKSRRVAVLKRQKPPTSKKGQHVQQLECGGDTAHEEGLLFPEIVMDDGGVEYEWVVLITDMDLPLDTLAQLYRDRADCENAFDELKNQWGWGGFTTKDLKRTSVMARATALVYNWWNIFCRLAEPDKHMEAQTSRPILQNVIGRLSRHGGKRLIHLTAIGAQAAKVRKIYDGISSFLASLSSTAEQLAEEARWAAILARAFVKFLKGKQLRPVLLNEQMLLLLSIP